MSWSQALAVLLEMRRMDEHRLYRASEAGQALLRPKLRALATAIKPATGSRNAAVLSQIWHVSQYLCIRSSECHCISALVLASAIVFGT